jgi:4-diphosphocytidyl-2-C-methyl-D-erythritol kinase
VLFRSIHPGFGISTAWTYQALSKFPDARNGTPGRAQRLIALLRSTDLRRAGAQFYNSLEVPVFKKYPLLALYQEFLRQHGAAATLMSGSGSTTFALTQDRTVAENLVVSFRRRFGDAAWTQVVSL